MVQSLALAQCCLLPAQRWDIERHHNLTGSAAIPFGGFMLCEPSAFDREAFPLAANEAALMDPQQRLLLECTAEAIRSAGCVLFTGCFICVRCCSSERITGCSSSFG